MKYKIVAQFESEDETNIAAQGGFILAEIANLLLSGAKTGTANLILDYFTMTPIIGNDLDCKIKITFTQDKIIENLPHQEALEK